MLLGEKDGEKETEDGRRMVRAVAIVFAFRVVWRSLFMAL